MQLALALAVLGVSYGGGPQGRIAMHDPVTLEPAGRSAVVHGYLSDSDRSPSGAAIALAASSRGRVAIYGTRPVAYSRTLETGRREWIMAVRWAGAQRLVALTPQHALELDLASGRVAARHPLGERPAAWAHDPAGLTVLVDGALLLLRAGAAPRRIALPGLRVRARTTPDVRAGDPPDLAPGLAISGSVAHVADAEAPRIVRVDLAGGTVSSHPLGAVAAKGGAARLRGLQALGGGRLLLTAQDVAFNGRVERSTTQLVDPTWGVRTLGGAFATGSPQGIVLPNFRRRYVDVFSARGRRLARLRPRFGIANALVAGRYAYVMNAARRGRNHRTHVLSLRTGRKVGSVPTTRLPHFLP